MKIAAVSYLNALPLTDGLPWPVQGLRPVALAGDGLLDFDLILAPVVTAFDDPRWKIVSDAPAIGCRGPVGSVRLDITAPHTIHTIRTIQLSPESRTSNQLLHVLLHHYWKRIDDVQCVASQCTSNEQRATSNALPDATLIIGDAALATPATPASIDLGGVWCEWTGLPFVFAAWMARTAPPGAVTKILRDTCARNLANVGEFASRVSRRASRGTATDTAALVQYFTQNLNYRFGAEEWAGLVKFREMVKACRGTRDDRSLWSLGRGTKLQ